MLSVMTEAEWLVSHTPCAMLKCVKQKASTQKLCCFMAACYRKARKVLRNMQGLTLPDFVRELRESDKNLLMYPYFYEDSSTGSKTYFAAKCVSLGIMSRIKSADEWGWGEDQCALLRDIFDNPFRPVHIDESWLRWNDGTIPKMAQTIYEERRFGDLPILTDALSESGCCDDQILNHCRGPGPHVRGCFVVDLLLGKS
jgi:hypothetical protein